MKSISTNLSRLLALAAVALALLGAIAAPTQSAFADDPTTMGYCNSICANLCTVHVNLQTNEVTCTGGPARGADV